MTFSVEINFKKGPSFTVNGLQADGEDSAKTLALNDAWVCGFREKVKKITVRKSQ